MCAVVVENGKDDIGSTKNEKRLKFGEGYGLASERIKENTHYPVPREVKGEQRSRRRRLGADQLLYLYGSQSGYL
jgi:hypothetical protein